MRNRRLPSETSELKSSTLLLVVFIGFVASILSASACGRKSAVQADPGDLSLTVRLERAADGRVWTAGTAHVPDGSWIYVEVRTDSKKLDGVFAEAFPVQSGVFTAVTPFSKPLDYHASAVLSPALNPSLSDILANAPERDGVMMRRAGESREILAETRASFGTAREREETAGRLAEDLKKNLDSLKKDFQKISSPDEPPDLSDWYGEFKRDKAAAVGQTALVYSLTLAGKFEDLIGEMETLFRLRLDRSAETGKQREKIEKASRKIDSLFESIGKSLTTLSENVP